MVQAPSEGGSVYTIALVGNLDRVRRVHRSLLNHRLQKGLDIVGPVEDSLGE